MACVTSKSARVKAAESQNKPENGEEGFWLKNILKIFPLKIR